jgi:hypothetical protein
VVTRIQSEGTCPVSVQRDGPNPELAQLNRLAGALVRTATLGWPHLPLWGGAFVAAGAALLLVQSYRLPRPIVVASHLLVAANFGVHA